MPYRPVPIHCSVISVDINKHASNNLRPQCPLQFSLLAKTKVIHNSCYQMPCPRSNGVQTRDLAHVISMLNHQISQLARSLDKNKLINSSLLEKCPSPARHPYSSTLIQIRLDQPLGWTRIKRAKSGGLKGCVTMELRSRFAVKYCKNKCHSSLKLSFLHSSRKRSQWGQTDALIEATQFISVWNFNGIMRGVTAAKIFTTQTKWDFR